MNKYTKTPNPPREEIIELYINKFMTQVEIANHYNATQKIVYRWFRDLGIKSRKPYKRYQRKELNHSWKTSGATYAALHYRVQSQRGKADRCEVCGRMDNFAIYEWANLTDKYDDINDYKMMCRSCHRQYDKSRREKGKPTINKRKIFDEEL